MSLTHVRKRDGRLEKFDPQRISSAITKAFMAIKAPDGERSKAIAQDVITELKARFPSEPPGVEEIQDIVEKSLMRAGEMDVAKAYMLYRQKRAEVRAIKKALGVTDELKLSINAVTVLQRRYLLRDDQGNIKETPAQLFRRVARSMTMPDKRWLRLNEVSKLEDRFYEMMAKLEFVPNTPTLMNAGTPLGQLSACFVVPVEDSLVGIFDALKATAMIQQSGGGTGFSFSRLRPKGDIVRSTHGIASGPVTFMSIFDQATNVIKQGGCIAANSLVRTDSGVMPMVNLLDCPSFGDNPTRRAVFTGGQFENAFLAEDNGLAPVHTIRTEIGTEISSTYNHQLATVDEQGQIAFKAAQDIKAGDWVVHVLGGHCGEDAPLPRLAGKRHHNCNSVKVPERMSQPLAELLGLYMSDGCVSGGRIIFAVENHDTELKRRIKYLMAELFGLGFCREEQKPDDGSSCLVFYSRPLADYFSKAGWTKAGAKHAFIPEHIMLSSEACAFAFLRGLFEGDGDVHSDGYPRLYSVSEGLIKQVQQLLLGLDIVSSWHTYRTANRYGKEPIHHLHIIQERSISYFIERIGFISTRKNRKLARLRHVKAFEPYDVIPNQRALLRALYAGPGRGSGPGRTKRGADRPLYRAMQHYLDTRTSQRNLTRKKLLELLERFPKLRHPQLLAMVDNRYFYSRVQTVTENHAYTMDISVPVSEHFVANGMLVHNKRRGANMGILRVDHPDIIEFITAKSKPGFLSNFNISVAATDKFMEAVEKDKDYELINPRNGEVVKKLPAREVWDLIIDYAWRTGDPGLVFIDRINKLNPTSNIGLIEATNPCGEQPLHPWDSCNLGSISLPKMLKQTKEGKWEVDWDKLKETVHRAVRFLDNVIDANKYPLSEISQMTRSNRRIGLGVMGFADALLMMDVPYDSEPALKMGTEIARFIEDEGHKASQALGKEKGDFPNFKGSLWDKKGYRWMRNATVTTIAPTGTISIIAGVSSGIEPLFAVSFVRNVLEGTKLLEVNSVFEKVAKERGFYSPELMHEIAKSGSVQNIKEVPADVKKVFKTALDIAPEWHVKMQAAWQKHCDNAVSKTINFPPDATKEDVRKAYQLAWKLGNKGITVYRYGSKAEQVLYIGEIETREKPEAEKLTQAPAETAGWCPFGQHCPAT
jgi:ribonucleoside-diphosphate reductase alpha chain